VQDRDSKPEIDPRSFRRVMGRFASGVTVVTAGAEGEERGMTANAFMSGSLEPPLCVVSIARRAHMHAQLVAAETFGVSILADGQEDVSQHFSGLAVPGLHAAFASLGGVPVLADACGRIAAEVAARHDCGDHTVFIGHILALDSDDRPPLLYHAGRYAGLVHRRRDHAVAVPEFW
jgi:flavin reductase (DIM6/NTAB) family NADH-FMN oxidoreductase RutF